MNAPVIKYSYQMPVGPPPPAVANMDILNMRLPAVCAAGFYLTKGFYRYGLPELMMCNLEINQASHDYFCVIVRNLMLDLANDGTKGQRTTQLLTSEQFKAFAFPAQVQTPQGAQSQILQAAIRKLNSRESYLLFANLYELAAIHAVVDLRPEEAQKIVQCGIAVVEMADENSYLPGHPGYDWRRVSKINSVTLQ